ncbi:hypothetical protein Pse7367_2338 [Thalassoporum mexicanum PCC 7367]|uniref:hypothetical protein n=1 Tax=Thalassoporum mexicanum TaxID=3457544 RepID=UPI00029FE18A|nr:hypothetical protein [Pseudanabaena sp. PCC 7367]AFY70599.1 hypothetical protein Pse7367_2338 [Pseudanabaena sp. PCC 7367]
MLDDPTAELFLLLKNYPIETSIEQFKSSNSLSILRSPLEQWTQGDIISEVPFLIFAGDGKPSIFKAPGITLTNTCDLVRRDYVSFCPCISASKLERSPNYTDILKQKVFEFFYIGRSDIGDELIVFLSQPMSLRRDRVIKSMENSAIKRVNSLTQFGWYYFITKFSIKYFRPDDPTTMESRG